MRSIKTILEKFDPWETDISRGSFSLTGFIWPSSDDYKHRGLYIKLAQTTHRSILEKALSYVSDSSAKNKGALLCGNSPSLKRKAQNKATK